MFQWVRGEDSQASAVDRVRFILTATRLTDHDPIRLNRIMISSFCWSMISAQTLRVRREGKPVPTFPDHALARSLADPCQHRLESDARQLQRGAFEVDHVAAGRPLQGEGDHVGSEQRLEAGVVIMPLGRNLGEDFVALVGVAPGKCKARIAAAKFARRGIDHAVSGAMNGMKFYLVEAFPQLASPAVVLDRIRQSRIAGLRSKYPQVVKVM